MGSAEQRRVSILRAIVKDYVDTGEPVGSKTLVERYKLQVSPATVRNDMSVLEELGYLHQPHTSAGRIPTEKGYRAFVDQITALQPLNPAQRRAIESFLLDALDFDDVVDRTARILAQLTRQLAVVQYPRASRRGLRHIELIPVSEHNLLVVIISDGGTVVQKNLETSLKVSELAVDSLATQLNVTLSGCTTTQIKQQAKLLETAIAPSLKSLFDQIIGYVQEALKRDTNERIVMAGAGNLVRHNEEFNQSMGSILDALEEQVTLLQLFSQIDTGKSQVAVRIGSENGNESLAEAAVIAGSYGNTEGEVAHIGIVGPTRIDYPGAMSAVRAVSNYLSRFIQ